MKNIEDCRLRQSQDLTYYATHFIGLADFKVHYGGLKGNASHGDGGRELEPHGLLTSKCQALFEPVGNMYRGGRIRGLFL